MSPTRDELKKTVIDHYEAIARDDIHLCEAAETITRSLGYDEDLLATMPEGVDMGLGCGNPQELAKPSVGERVLDIGSGRGLDSFIAARSVGPQGHIVGIDASPTMVEKANAIARKNGYDRCEFIQGDIESMPWEDDYFDLAMSNCVINLSPDKAAVYREVFRVLRPGGRAALSDITLKRDLPPAWANDATMTKT